MAFLLFLIQAVIISLSGVMAPGPITAATVGAGARSPHAGMYVALGHGIVEFPLMALVLFGLGPLLSVPAVKGGVLTLGGLFLLVMGVDMLRSVRLDIAVQGRYGESPLVAGVMLSLGNAYFLLWWATVGASLIATAWTFGVIGILVFAVVHWLCDFVWFWVLSAVSWKGGSVFGRWFQRVVFAVCGTFLLVFGARFLYNAVTLML